MKLSIIIPVYQVEAYVADCLRSVLETSADPASFELVVVNDGTKDRSMELVRALTAGHGNVSILEQENRGLSAARMAGLAAAKGEYVWFVDSDDYLAPDAVATVLGELSRETVDALVTPLLWNYPDPARNYQDIYVREPVSLDGKTFLREGQYRVSASVRFIIRKEILDPKWSFFPERHLHEDEYFDRVLLYRAGRLHILTTPLYHYRQREQSIMGGKDIRSSYDIVRIYRLLMQFMEAEVAPEDRDWFRKRCVEVLTLSYCHAYPDFRTRSFRRFLRENRRFIVGEYRKCIASRPARTIAADLFFLYCPALYVRMADLRYIGF